MSRTFKVQHPLANAEVGAIVTEEDLPGTNLDALVASGHLVEDGTENQTPDLGTDTIADESDSGHEGAE